MLRFTIPVLLAAAAPALAANPPKHLTDARDLVAHLKLADTRYEHGPGKIVWHGKVSAVCDCSGLLNHLLKHSYQYTDADLNRWFGATRPTARRYHDTIASGKVKEWHAVVRPKAARPGDVIAIKYPDAEPGENTGHVLLIDGAPTLVSGRPVGIAGAVAEWHVPVIDSTSSPHGTHDSRYEKGVKHTGVGRGTFRLYTDKDGHIVAYTWSIDSAKTVYHQKDHHVVIGRLVRE